MVTYLDRLHVSEKIIVVILLVFIVAEIIKALTVLWNFIGPKFFGVKSKYEHKKELESKIELTEIKLQEFQSSQSEVNEHLNSDFQLLKNSINDITDVVVSIQIENKRSIILDFASAIANGRVYTKEQYKFVMKTHREYQEIITKRKLKNKEVEASYKIIEEAFEKHVKQQDFIEDRLANPDFNEDIKDILDE